MTSMTGFGHGEHRDNRVQLVLEIRSYNNRYLELSINLPYSLKQLEPRVREFLSSHIQRGKVEFYLSVIELEEESEVFVDHARVRTLTCHGCRGPLAHAAYKFTPPRMTASPR